MILAYTLPHDAQRYDTAGDWYIRDDGTITVSVSRMSDRRHELLVAVHEIIEAALCHHRGISEDSVTAFDEAYEETRLAGDTSEPGDDPAAPYHREHAFATKVERMLAEELGVDWEVYEREINAL